MIKTIAKEHRCHPVSANTCVFVTEATDVTLCTLGVKIFGQSETLMTRCKICTQTEESDCKISDVHQMVHWWPYNSLTETGNGMGGQKLKEAWAKAESQATWKHT